MPGKAYPGAGVTIPPSVGLGVWGSSWQTRHPLRLPPTSQLMACPPPCLPGWELASQCGPVHSTRDLVVEVSMQASWRGREFQWDTVCPGLGTGALGDLRAKRAPQEWAWAGCRVLLPASCTWCSTAGCLLSAGSGISLAGAGSGSHSFPAPEKGWSWGCLWGVGQCGSEGVGGHGSLWAGGEGRQFLCILAHSLGSQVLPFPHESP